MHKCQGAASVVEAAENPQITQMHTDKHRSFCSPVSLYLCDLWAVIPVPVPVPVPVPDERIFDLSALLTRLVPNTENPQITQMRTDHRKLTADNADRR